MGPRTFVLALDAQEEKLILPERPSGNTIVPASQDSPGNAIETDFLERPFGNVVVIQIVTFRTKESESVVQIGELVLKDCLQ